MSFDDINNGADSVMYMGKYDAMAPDFEALSGFKLFAFNFKAAPKEGITMSHSKITEHKWAFDAEKGDYKSVEKSNSKMSMKQLDTNIDLQAANDKWSARFTREIPAGDWQVDGRFFIENKCTKEWKYEAAVESQSPDLGGFKLNANVSAELDKQKGNSKGQWTQEAKQVAMDACVQVENDYFVGAAWKVNMNLPDQSKLKEEEKQSKICEIQVGAGANMDDNNFWAMYDVENKQAKAGCQIKNKEVGFTHAYELKHYGAENAKYFKDYPVAIALGGKYQLSKATSFAYALDLSKQIHGQAKFTHKLDKNWQWSAHQSYDMGKKAEKPYNLGFDVTYTL